MKYRISIERTEFADRTTETYYYPQCKVLFGWNYFMELSKFGHYLPVRFKTATEANDYIQKFKTSKIKPITYKTYVNVT